MEKTRIAFLLGRCLNREATGEELEEFYMLASSAGNEAELEQLVQDILEGEAFPETLGGTASQEILASILQKPIERPMKRYFLLRHWWAAASIILLLCAGIYFWTANKRNPASPAVVLNSADIQPGKEGAVLMLADGSQVLLDTIQHGVVALQGGVVARVINGTLLYEGNGDHVLYNTMTTPKGRQFQLTLPDGTRVWLNSTSSIRYPTTFTGQERRVEITGEAYFDVAKNTVMPFRVDVRGKALVEVLGTRFNVNAYFNENSINTTLLEGRVKVSRAGSPAAILQPGQQARIGDESGITVDNVNVDNAIAWKEGIFTFNGLSFAAITRQLERWYDIEVIFQDHVPTVELVGEMSKDVPLSGVLKYFDHLGIDYRLEGKRLIILPGPGEQ